MFKVGDWVDFLLSAEKEVGYITEIIDRSEDMYNSDKIVTLSVPTTGKTVVIASSNLSPSDSSVRFEDVGTLIDLALATKDEKWFKELLAEKQTSTVKVSKEEVQ